MSLKGERNTLASLARVVGTQLSPRCNTTCCATAADRIDLAATGTTPRFAALHKLRASAGLMVPWTKEGVDGGAKMT